jgi:hypothetical protein
MDCACDYFFPCPRLSGDENGDALRRNQLDHFAKLSHGRALSDQGPTPGGNRLSVLVRFAMKAIDR